MIEEERRAADAGELAAMARRLESSADYRVLRRLAPRASVTPPPGARDLSLDLRSGQVQGRSTFEAAIKFR